eukprot:4815354-Heterocapsa_arctica.AAC.1
MPFVCPLASKRRGPLPIGLYQSDTKLLRRKTLFADWLYQSPETAHCDDRVAPIPVSERKRDTKW